MISSANPALPATTFSSLRYQAARSEAMTIHGTIYKTILLLLLALSIGRLGLDEVLPILKQWSCPDSLGKEEELWEASSSL